MIDEWERANGRETRGTTCMMIHHDCVLGEVRRVFQPARNDHPCACFVEQDVGGGRECIDAPSKPPSMLKSIQSSHGGTFLGVEDKELERAHVHAYILDEGPMNSLVIIHTNWRGIVTRASVSPRNRSTTDGARR